MTAWLARRTRWKWSATTLGLRQRLVDGGAVDAAGVHRDDPHRVPPGLPALVQPVHDSGFGATGCLTQQPLWTCEVDEVGLEPLGQPPLAGSLVLHPARSAAAGLIDAQHRHRLGLDEGLVGGHDPGGVADRPADQPVPGDADGQAVRDPPGDVTTQPTGDPGAGRELGDLVGERLARTWHLTAGPLPLVPPHHQAFLALR